MTTFVESIEVSCATEVFLATALLHQEQPERAEFTIQEIVTRAARENMAGTLRSGISVHASQHCVANRPPNPAKHRMLFATGKHTRRLLLPADTVDPERTGKIFPEAGEIPEKYLPLLEWAKQRFEAARKEEPMRAPSRNPRQNSAPHRPVAPAEQTAQGWLEGLLEMEGLGKEYWRGVDPDEFVRKLREGWE